MIIDQEGNRIDLPAKVMAEEIVRFLKTQKFKLGRESLLQEDLCDRLSEAGFEMTREVRLGGGNRDIIDGMIEKVGIECKVSGQKLAIFRQCERYMAYDQIEAMILVTNVSMGLPKEISGKPIYYINLGRAWL